MQTYVTPEGSLTGYVAVVEPRDYQGDGKFKYSFQLLVKGKEALALAKEIDAHNQAAVLAVNDATKKKHQKDQPPYANVVDDNGDTIEGELVFRFRCPATWKDGTSRLPRFYDIAGNKMEPPKKIGPGSRVRVRYAVYTRAVGNKAGVTLQPIALQVIDIVEFQGAGGGAEEGFDSLLPEVDRDATPPF